MKKEKFSENRYQKDIVPIWVHGVHESMTIAMYRLHTKNSPMIIKTEIDMSPDKNWLINFAVPILEVRDSNSLFSYMSDELTAEIYHAK